MLPVWLSDIRGCFLALLVSALANFLGVGCRWLVVVLSCCFCSALAFSAAFYVHTTRTVFNRQPVWTPRTFWVHLLMTRPLEALWRLATFPLRTTPDFHILGEVRTGTTTLAAHLRELGCCGPFSPWIVPLASDKESFYFVGHYFGFVHPGAYRMCFPLKVTVWFRRRVLGQPFPVFDACASHLNAPWAAPLLWAAEPRAALVVLLRPPAEQHVSWWKLELGSHAWARAMGMSPEFLPKDYPPGSFREALALSRSERVETMYKEGELLGSRLLAATGSAGGLLRARVPPRLLPFPGGQLAAFEHMGRYADNLQRYVSLFGMGRVLALETRELSVPGGVDGAARRLGGLVPAVAALEELRSRGGGRRPAPELVRLNGAPAVPAGFEPTKEDVEELHCHYREHNARLFELLGRDLGWNADS